MTSRDEIDECRNTAALYSLGALPPEEKSRFEQRLAAGCPFCVSEVAEYSSIADDLPLSAPVQNPPPSLRKRLLERIQHPNKPASHKPPSEMTIVRSGESQWMPAPVPGVQIRLLLGQKTLLVRMQPGAVYPAHQHQDAEQCYVLEGSVTDSNGVTAYAGDFVCMPRGSTHEPIHTDSGCTFLIAYTA